MLYGGAMRTEFGQRLLEARKAAKLTQVQLAKAAGMSQANYAELEKSGQGSAFTPKIAYLCGVSVEWLAYGTGEMNAANPLEALPARLKAALFTIGSLLQLIPEEQLGAAMIDVAEVLQKRFPLGIRQSNQTPQAKQQ